MSDGPAPGPRPPGGPRTPGPRAAGARAAHRRPRLAAPPARRRGREATGPRVVALGGGHGLAASLGALRRVTDRLTAVVGVADDGGSSGRLRRELGLVPPGDLRMALAALCGDDVWGQTWSRVVQHRFAGSGEMAGHALGNLLIAALWEETGDVVEGLDWVAELLGVTGRVLPLSTAPMAIAADVRGLDPGDPGALALVRGQAAVATTTGTVVHLHLEPPDPDPCPQALAALARADLVVLGPGSWFTSVLPHLLVPAVARAVAESAGRRVLVLNLVPQPGETAGFAPETHLEVLAAQLPDVRLDTVIADPGHVPDAAALRAACATVGAELRLAPVAAADHVHHDPAALAEAFGAVLARGRIGPWR